jgi:hypothetical protein
MKRIPFNHIAEQATTMNPKWALRDKVLFYGLNPNGLCAEKLRNNRVISYLVGKYNLPNGAIIAYGTFASYEYDKLFKMVNKAKVDRVAFEVAVQMLQAHVVKQRQFIDSIANQYGLEGFDYDHA